MIQFTGKDEYFFFVPNGATEIEINGEIKSVEDFTKENDGYVEEYKNDDGFVFDRIIVFSINKFETLTFIVDGINVYHPVSVRPLVNIIKKQ